MKKMLILLCLSTIFNGTYAQKVPHKFKIADGNFLLDGKPFQIISGEMHFARIPEEYWRDRFKMAKAMGLNTIATYIFWNFHEPEKGKYNFSSNADVAKFVKIAQEEGLWIIIRPSPYACAEWEFGGYPWWLIKEKGLKVRSKDPKFLDMSRKYYTELAKQLAPLQITKGGPIIMVQLENEYGSYDKDKEYLTINKEIIRDAGFDVELYTCDGPTQMPNGYLPGLLPAVNGLDKINEVRELINKHHNDEGPYFIAEWYPAWFDSWGLEHHTVPAAEYVNTLDTILANGLSINMYMAHGGTTRGFMNGANYNYNSPYQPQTSSYDYDAPIDEAGNVTPKYLAFREVIKKHLPKDYILPEVPGKKKTIAIPHIKLDLTADLFNNLPSPISSRSPLSFEDIDQAYGHVLYRTKITGPQKGILNIINLRDYALVFIDNKRIGILDRRLKQDSLEIEIPAGEVTLNILLENLGRINYGPFLNDNRKGITERVTLNNSDINDWLIYKFPFNDFSNLKFSANEKLKGPVVRKGSFSIIEVGDTYLDMTDWGKGCVWINGHNLGRYWYIGPQQTLYIPAPWLKKGENEIEIFEMLNNNLNEVHTIEIPILSKLNNNRK